MYTLNIYVAATADVTRLWNSLTQVALT